MLEDDNHPANTGSDVLDGNDSLNEREKIEKEINRLRKELYGYALRLTKNHQDAEDLFQETVKRAWKCLREDLNIRAYLFTTMTNENRSRKARKKNFKPIFENTQAESFSNNDIGNPEEVFGGGSLSPEVKEALRALPEEYRSVVVLKDVHDFSYDEIVGALGVPLGTVKSRLFRGRAMLQESLHRYAEEAGILKKSKKKISSGGDTA